MVGKFFRRTSMYKIGLKIVAIFTLISSHARAMDNNNAIDFIVSGLIAGCTIEFVNFIRKEQRYKHAFHLVRNYPGFAMAGISSIVGLGIMYGRPLVPMLSKYSFSKKQ